MIYIQLQIFTEKLFWEEAIFLRHVWYEQNFRHAPTGKHVVDHVKESVVPTICISEEKREYIRSLKCRLTDTGFAIYNPSWKFLASYIYIAKMPSPYDYPLGDCRRFPLKISA